MRLRSLVVLALALCAPQPARADAPEQLRPQVQADLGLSVIYAAYEQPLADHIALGVAAGTFGTYFLPWFDAGDNVIGFGGGLRATWFRSTTGHGLYLAPFVRANRVAGDKAGVHGTGLGGSVGLFAGWAFAVSHKIDVRLGGGVEYFYIDAGPLQASTPFIALDLLVGYRL
jgi:hypothetical protein